MNKELKYILEEMFKRVDAKFSEAFVEKDLWFHKYSWTEEEQKEYMQWLEGYLTGSKEARDSLMAYPSKKKKAIKKCIQAVILTCGWKLK